MANVFALNQIEKFSDRKIFFDANVLIYLFWPSGSNFWENSYSKAFAKLLRNKNELFVDFLVISETVNRIYRIEYEKYLFKNNYSRQQYSYKYFRNGNEGKSVLSDIYLIVKSSILNHFSVVGKPFEKNDIENFLVVEPLDFVDKAILSICMENNFVLCTNDSDYRYSNIDILTSNPAIVKYNG